MRTWMKLLIVALALIGIALIFCFIVGAIHYLFGYAVVAALIAGGVYLLKNRAAGSRRALPVARDARRVERDARRDLKRLENKARILR